MIDLTETSRHPSPATLAFEPAPDPPDAEPRAKPYGLLGLAVSTILILVASLLLLVAAVLLAFALAGVVLGWRTAIEHLAVLRGSLASDETNIQRTGVVTSLLLYAALSCSVLLAARIRAGGRWRDLVGWHPWSPFRGARVFWIVSASMIAYSLAADLLIAKLYPPSNDWITLPTGKPWAALFVILAVVFAPVTEELFFRGWLHTSLREKIGTWASILITALLFAVAHWEKTHLYAAAVFPLGIALGYVRQRFDSLKASMALHAVYNAVASVLLASGM